MIASGKSAAPPLRMSKRCFLLIVECGQWPAELLFEHYLEGSDLPKHLGDRISIFPLSGEADLYRLSHLDPAR